MKIVVKQILNIEVAAASLAPSPTTRIRTSTKKLVSLIKDKQTIKHQKPHRNTGTGTVEAPSISHW